MGAMGTKRPPARELLVARHAKASRDSDARSDFDRPLAGRGRSDAPAMGARLRRKEWLPDLVLASPALRARETTMLLLEGLGFDAQVVRWEPLLYATGLETHLKVLAGCPRTARRVMIVGHNPTLEDLVRHLGGREFEEPEDGKVMPTGAVARVRMPANWGTLREGAGRVLSILRPKDRGE
jgi:phosphohistidine phosphatase